MIGLQALDGVGEVRISANVVLGARGQYEWRSVLLVGLDGGRDAIGRESEVVEACFSAVVLDRAASEGGRRCLFDCQRHILGVVAKAVLEIGAHREWCRSGEQMSMRDGFVTSDLAIRASEARSMSGAGRCQRGEAERGEEPRRSDVPGIGEDELRFVKSAEGLSSIHGGDLLDRGIRCVLCDPSVAPDQDRALHRPCPAPIRFGSKDPIPDNVVFWHRLQRDPTDFAQTAINRMSERADSEVGAEGQFAAGSGSGEHS